MATTVTRYASLGGENMWRTWLRHKKETKKKRQEKQEQGRFQLPGITDEEKLLSLLFL
jgi:hypothetical protein